MVPGVLPLLGVKCRPVTLFKRGEQDFLQNLLTSILLINKTLLQSFWREEFPHTPLPRALGLRR